VMGEKGDVKKDGGGKGGRDGVWKNVGMKVGYGRKWRYKIALLEQKR